MKRLPPHFDKRFPIVTAKVGKNADLFPDVLDMYVPDFSLILDLTFGKGAFWKRIPPNKYEVIRNDSNGHNVDLRSDYRWVVFKPESFDAVIFDPPYGQGSTTARTGGIAKQYRLGENSNTRTPDGILSQYRYGIINARCVLKPKGILIVKCQDMVNNGEQWWISDSIKNEAERFGFKALDRFVMVQDSTPIMRHNIQLHARKNHSYFWVFTKKGKK